MATLPQATELQQLPSFILLILSSPLILHGLPHLSIAPLGCCPGDPHTARALGRTERDGSSDRNKNEVLHSGSEEGDSGPHIAGAKALRSVPLCPVYVTRDGDQDVLGQPQAFIPP